MGCRGKNRGGADPHHGQNGQVAVLFALVFTFMFVLFAFVVDFGHLVNAKINLQNAADAAAYSGAAYQAQVLNRVGQINYKMRQDLKELAMRVNVTHLRHNKNFPRGSDSITGAPRQANVEPFVCQQAHGYRSISGNRYSSETNLCRNASPASGGLPPIVIPPVIAAFDPFAVAIAAQIRRIAEASDQECKAAGLDNRVLAEHLVTVYARRAQAHMNQATAMQQFMNGIGSGNAEGNNNPIVASALASARRNLTVANTEEFQMNVLEPAGGQYLSLIQHQMRASIFYFDFSRPAGGGCVGIPRSLDFDDMVVGFTKDQPIITYFAVKLSSKPSLMFMPQAWQEAVFPRFEAFAAAKPFGSRLGPESTADPLVPVPNRPGNASRSINFSFRPGDQFGIMNTKIMAYLDAIHPFNVAGRPEGDQNLGWPDPDKEAKQRLALQAIRSPTIFDAGFYTIHPDPNQESNYEESNLAAALYPDYMEAGGPNNEIIQQRAPATRPYFPAGVGPATSGDGWIGQFARNIQGNPAYGGYASEGPGSHSTVLATTDLPDINDGNVNEFGWATRQQLHSGWSPAGRPGRIGYSVKFIGFDALVRTMRIKVNETGARGPISNPPTGDDNIVNIYH